MSSESSIKSFTDLDTWKEGHKLVILVYRLTKKFPASEQFGLMSQMRRAAVSVTSNIAEGFSRVSCADKAHFLTMSHGSLTELQNQALIARDVAYLESADFEKIAEQTVITHKLLTGLLRSTKLHKKLHDS